MENVADWNKFINKHYENLDNKEEKSIEEKISNGIESLSKNFSNIYQKTVSQNQILKDLDKNLPNEIKEVFKNFSENLQSTIKTSIKEIQEIKNSSKEVINSIKKEFSKKDEKIFLPKGFEGKIDNLIENGKELKKSIIDTTQQGLSKVSNQLLVLKDSTIKSISKVINSSKKENSSILFGLEKNNINLEKLEIVNDAVSKDIGGLLKLNEKIHTGFIENLKIQRDFRDSYNSNIEKLIALQKENNLFLNPKKKIDEFKTIIKSTLKAKAFSLLNKGLISVSDKISQKFSGKFTGEKGQKIANIASSILEQGKMALMTKSEEANLEISKIKNEKENVTIEQNSILNEIKENIKNLIEINQENNDKTNEISKELKSPEDISKNIEIESSIDIPKIEKVKKILLESSKIPDIKLLPPPKEDLNVQVESPKPIPIESKPVQVESPKPIPIESKPVQVESPKSIPIESKPIKIESVKGLNKNIEKLSSSVKILDSDINKNSKIQNLRDKLIKKRDSIRENFLEKRDNVLNKILKKRDKILQNLINKKDKFLEKVNKRYGKTFEKLSKTLKDFTSKFKKSLSNFTKKFGKSMIKFSKNLASKMKGFGNLLKPSNLANFATNLVKGIGPKLLSGASTLLANPLVWQGALVAATAYGGYKLGGFIYDKVLKGPMEKWMKAEVDAYNKKSEEMVQERKSALKKVQKGLGMSKEEIKTAEEKMRKGKTLSKKEQKYLKSKRDIMYRQAVLNKLGIDEGSDEYKKMLNADEKEFEKFAEEKTKGNKKLESFLARQRKNKEKYYKKVEAASKLEGKYKKLAKMDTEGLSEEQKKKRIEFIKKHKEEATAGQIQAALRKSTKRMSYKKKKQIAAAKAVSSTVDVTKISGKKDLSKEDQQIANIQNEIIKESIDELVKNDILDQYKEFYENNNLNIHNEILDKIGNIVEQVQNKVLKKYKIDSNSDLADEISDIELPNNKYKMLYEIVDEKLKDAYFYSKYKGTHGGLRSKNKILKSWAFHSEKSRKELVKEYTGNKEINKTYNKEMRKSTKTIDFAKAEKQLQKEKKSSTIKLEENSLEGTMESPYNTLDVTGEVKKKSKEKIGGDVFEVEERVNKTAVAKSWYDVFKKKYARNYIAKNLPKIKEKLAKKYKEGSAIYEDKLKVEKIRLEYEAEAVAEEAKKEIEKKNLFIPDEVKKLDEEYKKIIEEQKKKTKEKVKDEVKKIEKTKEETKKVNKAKKQTQEIAKKEVEKVKEETKKIEQGSTEESKSEEKKTEIKEETSVKEPVKSEEQIIKKAIPSESKKEIKKERPTIDKTQEMIEHQKQTNKILQRMAEDNKKKDLKVVNHVVKGTGNQNIIKPMRVQPAF